MTCEELSHDLWGCHSPTPSANGYLIYVICQCKRRRALPKIVWEAEEDRRTHAAARLARMPEQRVEDRQFESARSVERAAQG